VGVGEAWDRTGAAANRPGRGAPFGAALVLSVAATLASGARLATAQEYPANPYPQPTQPLYPTNPFGSPAQPANPFQAPAQEYPTNPFPSPPPTLPGPGAGQGGGPAEPGQPPPPRGGGGGQAPGAQGAAVAIPPPLVFLPSIETDISFTDNALATTSQKQADAYATISPSLFATADTVRLKGTFNYSPEAIEHVVVSSQDTVIQNMLLNGTATIVPERFFFDGHAEMSEQSRLGGRGFGNTTQIQTSQATQTTAYTGSPYVQFHFGPIGDAELRYSLSQSVFSGSTGAINSTIPGQSVGPLSNSTQNDVSAKFTSGDVFQRFRFTGNADFLMVNESLNNERHYTLTAGGDYALTPTFDLTATAGYERLDFPEQSAASGFNGNFVGPTYQGGFIFHPREDRSVALNYGKTEGQNTFSGTASWAVTPLATLSASYASHTESQQQQLLDTLGTATQTTPGQTIDATTGLPLSLANPNLPLQNQVTRTKTLSAGALIQGGQRNHYTIQFNRTVMDTLTTGGSSTKSNGILVGWLRDLSPDLSSDLSGGYSTTSTGASGSSSSSIDTVTASAGLKYNLTPTLTGAATYTLSRESGVGGVILVDLVTIGLRKDF